jgi:sec-independent protein translocase protein TatA
VVYNKKDFHNGAPIILRRYTKMFGGGIGMSELVVIMIIALLIFGPSKLPEIGKGLGKAIRSFRDGASGLDEVDETHKESKKELEDAKRDT